MSAAPEPLLRVSHLHTEFSTEAGLVRAVEDVSFTLDAGELLFIEAARALGIATWRILFIHVLQNIASPILVQATFIFAYAVLAEAGLSFLGVGVPPVLPTWGSMISSGQQFAHQAIWLVVFPGIAIILSALSLQMVGDGFRDLLDPKLRKAL